jgi:hypothetical protein
MPTEKQAIEFETPRVKKVKNDNGHTSPELTIRQLEVLVNDLRTTATLHDQKMALQDQKIAFQEQLIGDLRSQVKGMQETQSTFKTVFEKQMYANRQLAAGDAAVAH